MTLNIPRRHSHMVLQQEVVGGNRRQTRRWAGGAGGLFSVVCGVRGGQVEVGGALRLVSGTRPSRCLSYTVKKDKESVTGCRVPQRSAETEGWREVGGRDQPSRGGK